MLLTERFPKHFILHVVLFGSIVIIVVQTQGALPFKINGGGVSYIFGFGNFIKNYILDLVFCLFKFIFLRFSLD